MSAELKRWGEGNQRDLRKLAALINKIVNVVKGCGGNAIVNSDHKGDKLIVGKDDGKGGTIPKAETNTRKS